MYFPRLKIDTGKISHNARIINDRCAGKGISVVGVTKCILAHEAITPLLEHSGIKLLADSRLANIRRLSKSTGDPSRIMMLRTPMPDETEELINICSTSLNTQVETVEKLAFHCDRYNKHHNIIIMVEIDDEREGLLPEQAEGFCRQLMGKSKYICIKGIGTNARCITSNGPTRESIDILVSLKKELEGRLGLGIEILSGGNSSIWDMIESGKLPSQVNQVRMGEAIFLGHETAGYSNIKGLYQDSFVLEACIIEVKKRDNIPYRIILGLGIQDVMLKDLIIADRRLLPRSQSSDHTMLDIDPGAEDDKAEKDFSNYQVGGIISFNLNYFGLLSCMTSPFVRKELI
jgi:predicted amino acid racemase